MKAQTAELLEATVSGTLYADNIHGFDSKIASAFTNQLSPTFSRTKFSIPSTPPKTAWRGLHTIALAG